MNEKQRKILINVFWRLRESIDGKVFPDLSWDDVNTICKQIGIDVLDLWDKNKQEWKQE